MDTILQRFKKPDKSFILEKECLMTLTDSGKVQEESSILKKPCLIIREYTERPETLDAGGAKLVGNNTQKIINTINIHTILTQYQQKGIFTPEYI